MFSRKKRSRRLCLESLESRWALALMVNASGNAPDADPLDSVCDVDPATPGEQVTLAAAAQCATLLGDPEIELAADISAQDAFFGGSVVLRGNGFSITLASAAHGLIFNSWARLEGVRLAQGGLLFLGQGSSLEQVQVEQGEVSVAAPNVTVTNSTFAAPPQFPLALNVIGQNFQMTQSTVIGGARFDGLGGTMSENTFIGGQVQLLGDERVFAGNRIYDSPSHGLVVQGSHNQILSNYIGTDGQNARGSAAAGLVIDGGAASHDNLVKDNVISGNAQEGILLRGDSTTVAGNKIGTSDDGTIAISNGGAGILIDNVAGSLIGGPETGARNIISGNLRGIAVQQGVMPRALGTIIEGNYIGLSADGMHPLPNQQEGILLGASQTTRGDTTIRNNIISGNEGHGIDIQGSGTKVYQNRIGLAAVDIPIGNLGDGIHVEAGEGDDGKFNQIGGPDLGNTISGNGLAGIRIDGGSQNAIQGNYIGTNAAGTAALGNQTGVVINASENLLGGTTAAATNIISGNLTDGIVIAGSNNHVFSNILGLALGASAAVPNGRDGIVVLGGANNRIGDEQLSTGNIIAANGRHGVLLSDGTTGNRLLRNLIGLGSSFQSGLGNGGDGVHIENASQNEVGAASISNVIGGNAGSGVRIAGPNSTQNQVRFNLIGVGLGGAGGVARGNQQGGVTIEFAASQNIVGGAQASERNIISANGAWGIAIRNAAENHVLGNYIGTDINGTAAIPSASQPVGILLDNGAIDNIVGLGASGGQFNLISANSGPGIEIRGASTAENIVAGNLIGLAVGLGPALANQGPGITLHSGTHDNRIGGTTPNTGNVIAANTGGAVVLASGAHHNELKSNVLGFNPGNGATFANSGHGVLLDDAHDNLIGDPSGAFGNIIRGNSQSGVRVQNGALRNRIQGNPIYDNGGLGISLDEPLASLGRQVVLRQIVRNGSLIQGVIQVKGPPNTTVRVDYYGSIAADGSGIGEGQRPLAFNMIDIPASGIAQASISVQSPDPVFNHLTAVLTDADGTSYDFSHALSPGEPASSIQSLTASQPRNDYHPIHLTATVTGAVGVITGPVEFYHGDTLLGTAMLDAQGKATLTTHLAIGQYSIVAVYRGSNGSGGHISSPLAITVVQAPPNVPPQANTDTVNVLEDDEVTFQPLANDSDSDGGTLLPGSVTITQPPAHGTASVDPQTGEITYTPHGNYDGPDTLRYTVTDDRGGVSNAALVNITVVDIPEPWHNKAMPLDVDGDEIVTPLDSVLIINELNAGRGGPLAPPQGEAPLYYDVDGDNLLTPLDSLLIINALNGAGNSEPAGEPEEEPLPLDAFLAAHALWQAEADAQESRRRKSPEC